jgi:hypothetical protein
MRNPVTPMDAHLARVQNETEDKKENLGKETDLQDSADALVKGLRAGKNKEQLRDMNKTAMSYNHFEAAWYLACKDLGISPKSVQNSSGTQLIQEMVSHMYQGRTKGDLLDFYVRPGGYGYDEKRPRAETLATLDKAYATWLKEIGKKGRGPSDYRSRNEAEEVQNSNPLFQPGDLVKFIGFDGPVQGKLVRIIPGSDNTWEMQPVDGSTKLHVGEHDLVKI